MISLTFAAALAALVPLVSIFVYVVSKGLSHLNMDFFINLPKPVGEPGGGMANAILGSLLLIFLSSLWSVPLGIAGGIYLSEFSGRKGGNFLRFTADVLSGVPSIVVGIFVYTLLVMPMKSFSAISGVLALGIIMLPSIVRITEEMLKLVPQNLREASLALGISRAGTIIRIVLPSARGGIITGVMLSVARIAGETAPLLFTAFGNRFWNRGLGEPVAALPLQIFAYAISPYEDWQNQAWAGALVLIAMVLVMNLTGRFFMRDKINSRKN